VKKILLLIVVFFIAVYFVLMKFFPNVEINKYDSLVTVEEQGVIEKGWVPKNLPASAYDIVETHDIDTHIVLGKFSYKESDEESFLKGLKAEDEVYEGEGFLFKVDRESNLVNFRSK
jgi:hypothetical protein